MNTISFTKGNNVIKRGDNVTPLSIKLMPENEIDKANITVRLSNSLGYLMDLEKVYINEDKTLNIILTDKETEQLPSDIYGLEVWVSKDDRDIIYPSDGQAMFRLTNNSLDVTGSSIPVITLEQFVDRYDELEQEVNAVVSESKETVTEITTNAIMEVIETVSNAKISLSQIVTTGTAEIGGIKEIAISTIRTEINNMLKVIADNQAVKYTDAKNWQKNAITTASGAPRYDLSSAKDLFAEIKTWGNGFFTFYLSAGATNNPTGTKSWLRGRVSTYGKNSDVLSYDKDGSMHVVVCANGIWGSWDKTALSSDLQVIKGSNTGWLPLPLLNGVTAATPCFYRFYSTNGIYYLSFKGVLKTLSTRDVTIAKLPEDVATKIDRPLTWVGNTSVSANAARFNRWVVEADGTIKFAISNFGSVGESGAWNPLDVTLTL